MLGSAGTGIRRITPPIGVAMGGFELTSRFAQVFRQAFPGRSFVILG